MILVERPSRSIEIEVARFLNINNKTSGKEIAKDVFTSIEVALEASRLSKLDKLDFWLELETLIVDKR